MKKIITLLLVAFLVSNVWAQNKELTIDEAVLKGRTTLAPERLAQLQWIPNTNTFSYIGKKNGNEILLVVNTSNLKRDTALTIEEFNSSYFNITADSKKIERFPASF